MENVQSCLSESRRNILHKILTDTSAGIKSDSRQMWLLPPYCNLQYYDTSIIARHHCPAEQQVCHPLLPSCSIRPHTCRRMPYCQDMPWDNQRKLYYCIRPCTCPCTPCCLDSRHSSSYYIPTYICLCILYWRGTPWCRLRQPSYYILPRKCRCIS